MDGLGVQGGIRQSLVKLLHHPSPTPGTCSRVRAGCHGVPVSGGQWVSVRGGGTQGGKATEGPETTVWGLMLAGG